MRYIVETRKKHPDSDMGYVTEYPTQMEAERDARAINGKVWEENDKRTKRRLVWPVEAY